LCPVIKNIDAERDAVLQAARLMLLAARTAPKSAGVDDILTSLVHGIEKDAIADKMLEIAEQRGHEGFKRDAKNVRDSEAVVLIGARGTKSLGINCGACGYETCKDFEAVEKKRRQDFEGPTCLFKSLDMGIALGSAAKVAAELNVDNRIMYRIGAAATKLKMLPDASIMMGIPLSAKGKNIYFDRTK
jgi:uncharacterized ferredoxin-like protein